MLDYVAYWPDNSQFSVTESVWLIVSTISKQSILLHSTSRRCLGSLRYFVYTYVPSTYGVRPTYE